MSITDFNLPYETITKIPNTLPDAIPELWNNTYREIDSNFTALTEKVKEEIENLNGAVAAVGGNSSTEFNNVKNDVANLKSRVSALESNGGGGGGIDPNIQNEFQQLSNNVNNFATTVTQVSTLADNLKVAVFGSSPANSDNIDFLNAYNTSKNS